MTESIRYILYKVSLGTDFHVQDKTTNDKRSVGIVLSVQYKRLIFRLSVHHSQQSKQRSCFDCWLMDDVFMK